MRALEKKGFINIESGTSRGISLVNQVEIEEDGFPIIGLVAAGFPTLPSDNLETTVNCPPTFFGSGVDKILRERGNSMKDAGIMEDDLIAVKKTQDIRNGDIVVARIEDEVTVKYFERKSPEVVHLIPANEDFKNIEIDLRETEIHIEGKSVGLIREN